MVKIIPDCGRKLFVFLKKEFVDVDQVFLSFLYNYNQIT